MNNPRTPIILFDGSCGLCHRAVRFVLRHERASVITFASLQSATGTSLLSQHRIPVETDAMVLVEGDSAYVAGVAAVRLSRYLRAPYCWLAVFRILPDGFLNACYRQIAKRRLRWFGSVEACELPAPEQQNRFIVDPS